ncbi:MAG: type II secretion system F family protein [Chloroflexota bacterium]|nr:type II secretion system F family protein [Chloroflexota bacterium]
MDPLVILIAAGAGLGVLLIFFSLAGGSDVNARLERYAAGDEAKRDSAAPRDLSERIATSAALANFNRVIERRDWGSNMARELARADLALKPTEFLAIRAGAIVGVPLVVIALSPLISVLSSPLVWAVALVLGWWLPKFWLGRRKGKRLKAFNSELSDTIMLLANSLRAGSSFLQAVEMIVRESRPPISTEFARVIREVNLGLPLDEALANLQRRVRSDDLDLMTTAIAIHHTVGGNLAEILDSIAFTIRERVRIKGDIRTLTAQQRMSGYVVGFLPVGLVIVMSVIAPTFMAPMLQKPPELMGLPAGMFILAGGGFMMLIGFILIRRIVDIEV